MTGCLLILSSCSINPPAKPTYIYERGYIEPSLLEVGCEEIGAGETVRTLAKGYVHNRSCLRAYVKLIDGIKRTYTKEGVEDATK